MSGLDGSSEASPFTEVEGRFNADSPIGKFSSVGLLTGGNPELLEGAGNGSKEAGAGNEGNSGRLFSAEVPVRGGGNTWLSAVPDPMA